MKKNLITVVILAISIINLVFNILLVFVFCLLYTSDAADE